MSTTLRDALAQRIDQVGAAHPDVDALVGLGERRLRRRQVAAVLGSAAAVLVVIALVIGGATLIGPSKHSTGPIDKPSPTPTPHVEPATRKLVYVDGFWPMRKVHVGDQTIDISDQLPPRHKQDFEWGMVFLQVSGDGVVLLTHDGRVWFTDGTEVVRIGQTGSDTRISSAGELQTGMIGSIAAWRDATSDPTEMVVYDTTQRAEVGRIPCPNCGEPLIAGTHVYWEKNENDARSKPWVRFDPKSGETSRVPATAANQELASHPRALIVGDSQRQGQVGTGLGQQFQGVDGHLVPLADPKQPGVPVYTKAWDTGSGKQLDLQMPTTYDGDTLRVFDWIDDDRLALTANDDIGRPTDILVCRTSSGTCHVAVPGTPPRFVANIGFD